MEPDRGDKLTALYHAAGVKSALQIKHLLEGRKQQQHQPTTESTFVCGVCCERLQPDVSLRLFARAHSHFCSNARVWPAALTRSVYRVGAFTLARR
jgi:hypothetical protein